ncbi:MAG: twin-arginine translocation signal domain-containing protein [Planctomycetota bacterium]
MASTSRCTGAVSRRGFVTGAAAACAGAAISPGRHVPEIRSIVHRCFARPSQSKAERGKRIERRKKRSC